MKAVRKILAFVSTVAVASTMLIVPTITASAAADTFTGTLVMGDDQYIQYTIDLLEAYPALEDAAAWGGSGVSMDVAFTINGIEGCGGNVCLYSKDSTNYTWKDNGSKWMNDEAWQENATNTATLARTDVTGKMYEAGLKLYNFQTEGVSVGNVGDTITIKLSNVSWAGGGSNGGGGNNGGGGTTSGGGNNGGGNNGGGSTSGAGNTFTGTLIMGDDQYLQYTIDLLEAYPALEDAAAWGGSGVSMDVAFTINGIEGCGGNVCLYSKDSTNYTWKDNGSKWMNDEAWQENATNTATLARTDVTGKMYEAGLKLYNFQTEGELVGNVGDTITIKLSNVSWNGGSAPDNSQPSNNSQPDNSQPSNNSQPDNSQPSNNSGNIDNSGGGSNTGIKGDVNGDGVVDILDVVIVRSIIVNGD